MPGKMIEKLNKKLNKNKLFLILIFILAFIFRFYGINWDSGHHLHPDERMIIMVTERIHLPKPLTFNALLSPQSSLNPKFFAYGSLPIYLLKLAGNMLSFSNPVLAHYQGLNLVGRFLSILFELGTIILIFKISKKLLLTSSYKLAALFYALSVLAIQTAHFYVVDIPLTFFITLTLYRLLKLHNKPSLKYTAYTGIAFGLALATKVSAILLIIPVLTTLFLIFIKRRSFSLIFKFLVVIFTFSFLVFSLAMPYALIDFPTFKTHTLEQSRMTKDAFVFPYTLQYVNTTPYLYQLKNMVLWGMGVPLGVISVVGAVFVGLLVILNLIQNLYRFWILPRLNNRVKAGKSGMTKRNKLSNNFAISPARLATRSVASRQFRNLTILLSFFLPYLLVTGSFAIKFMRYWLPIYPLFCIFGEILISQMIAFLRVKISKIKYKKSKLPAYRQARHIKNQKERKILHFGLPFWILIFAFCISLWPLAFVSIYSQPNTRVQATEWIKKNIGQGSTLSVEHWDDRVPMSGEYEFLEMPMYEPDTSEQKWGTINSNLEKTDYIIIASNRLYTPLMNLTDCESLPRHRCYPKTNEYYQKLFSGALGFTKVAQFTSFPKLEIAYLPARQGNWKLEINDSSSDESFTVYDHPKVMIFKKTSNNQN